jgi:hypothetical protein
MSIRRSNSVAVFVLALVGVFVAGLPLPTIADAEEPTLPIVFVHGGAGSAAQYETQAQRWASNDYPNIVAGIDRTTSDSEELNPILDDFIDDVLAQTGDDQVYALGHSYGSLMMKNYLNSSPERSARVAKFISLDSGSAGVNPVCPGTPDPVPCMGIYRTENSHLGMGPDNVYLVGGHVEMATSDESFTYQYEFFTGNPPATTLVLPEPPGQVEVAGRLIDFPANIGVGGATVEIWQVDPATGARQELKAVIDIDESGDWGPVKLNGQKHHEFQSQRPDSDLAGHIYTPPFLRDDYLVRLLTAPPGSPSLIFTHTSENHSAAVILRYREWWSDHSTGENDILQITTMSMSRGTEAAGNILSPATGNGSIGLHVHDAAATPGDSTLDLLPVIPLFPFQTGVDVFMPATDPPDGIISFVNAPRGDGSRLQVLNAPNWESVGHRISVYFHDYVQDVNSWGECKQAGLCRK